MTELLLKLFVKNNEDIKNPKVRENYGVFSSVVGMVCNILLFLAKFALGTLANSVAITADAFNNLSDVGSSLVTLLGFKLAAMPPDKNHPYGHGRVEYLSGLAIAALILVVGLEFVKSSVEKILHPEVVVFSTPVVIGLVLSIGVKLWMNRFNVYLGRKIDSATLTGTAADSLSDAVATTVTLISVILARFTTLPIDGFMGLIVAGFILFAGYNVAKDTISPLLGHAPDPELVREIRHRMMGYEGIIGVHDLMVHDYGPGRIFVNAHAEVPMENDILYSHEVIDTAEREIGAAMGLQITIHMDPIDITSEHTLDLRRRTVVAVHEVNPAFSIHDFRVVNGVTLTNLIFDVLVPIDLAQSDEEIRAQVEAKIREIDPIFFPVITVDRDYT